MFACRRVTALNSTPLKGTCRRISFFKRKSKERASNGDPTQSTGKGDRGPTQITRRHNNRIDGPLTQETTGSLKTFGSLRTTRAYTPPDDVEDRVQTIVSGVCHDTGDDWRRVELRNPAIKYKLLTRLMSEFDHDIPNSELDQIRTTSDALDYFLQPVKDTTRYEDLSRLPLPPNLHIQMEPHRFDPKSDTMFGGVTAFPGRPTIVTSLKQRHKYKGTNRDDTLPEGYIPRRGDS